MASKCSSRITPFAKACRQWTPACINANEISRLASSPAVSRSCQRSSSPAFRTRPYATSSKTLIELKTTQDTSGGAFSTFDQQLRAASRLLTASKVPDEQMVERALRICENLAMKLAAVAKNYSRSSKSFDGPTTNLLSIQGLAVSAKGSSIDVNNKRKIRRISEIAYKIAQDPKVFMTQKLLKLYVSTQNLLAQPQSFPHVFDLFASKAIPKAGSSPPTFKDSNVNSQKAAIPLSVAQSALNGAIEIKNLALCLSIIETSVSTSAFRRAKFIRKALFPISALALSPIAAYNLAWQFCKTSDLVDPQTLTNYATVCIVTYIGITVSLGFVAITTANDQMDRITWIPGTALSERWSREEERALIDQVAGAWGLKNREKRGSEEGWEWEELRNWTFKRGMYLDKPELMDGME